MVLNRQEKLVLWACDLSKPLTQVVTWLSDGRLDGKQGQQGQQELAEVLQFAVASIVVGAREP